MLFIHWYIDSLVACTWQTLKRVLYITKFSDPINQRYDGEAGNSNPRSEASDGDIIAAVSYSKLISSDNVFHLF